MADQTMKPSPNSLPSSRENNRRDFLKKAIAASAATLVLPSLTSISLLASSPQPKSYKHRYKIGTCDWTLKTPLTSDSFHLANRIGVTGLQYSFSLKGEGLDLRSKENRDTIRQTVKETGVGITSLGMAILNKVPYSTAVESQQIVIDCINSMATMKKEATQIDDRELAAKVAPDIVLMGFFGKGDINGHPDLIEKVIEKLKVVAPLAEKHGVILGIESLLNEADHRHILESVGSPAVKVYYDVANSHRMGYDIYKEMKSLGSENICQIHCKEDKTLLGNGPIDFNRIKSIIETIGYKDWLIIEGAKPKGVDLEIAYQQNAAYLNSVFNG